MAIITREQLENNEKQFLAPYAMLNANSRGRKFSELKHRLRTDFQRDRDRIIHCSAFRRLEYKTQVFVNHEGDNYRTRLTHTIEVVQISRTISRSLRLNDDLTEAIALAHDLGHTPFGHSGEEALNDLMKKYGGFEHNNQSLRIVDFLEKRYNDFPGLNLTYEVREGIIKHKTDYDKPSRNGFNDDESATMEAQIINIADEIAYNNHDIDDGLTANMITFDDLREIPWISDAIKKVENGKPESVSLKKYSLIRELINYLVTSLVEETEKRLKKYKINSVKDVRKTKHSIVAFPADIERNNSQLKAFLMERVYRHYRVERMHEKARRFVKAIFEEYVKNSSQLPPDVQKKFKNKNKRSKATAVCDYVAGMTDRYALDEYNKLFQPYEKV